MVRVAINGFGRIGRNVFKIAFEAYKDQVTLVAINDLTTPSVLAHLLKYDTSYGVWNRDITADEKNLIVDGVKVPVYAIKEPTELPWKDLNVDVVIESTGRFTKPEDMGKHLTAGAKKVILSAPAKGDGVSTFLMGVNDDTYNGETLTNNASCTTNCVAPVVSVIEQNFGIVKAMMTTIHGYTAEQNLIDGPPPGGKSNDLRRARAAAENIIPTTTGATIAVTQVLPSLKDKFEGSAIRVPVPVGSITDFTFLLKQKVTVEQINEAFRKAANSQRLKGILAASDGALVSSDIVGRSESAIVDLPLTQVVDGDMVKVFAWYDNEMGYSHRLIEQVINIGTK